MRCQATEAQARCIHDTAHTGPHLWEDIHTMTHYHDKLEAGHYATTTINRTTTEEPEPDTPDEPDTDEDAAKTKRRKRSSRA